MSFYWQKGLLRDGSKVFLSIFLRNTLKWNSSSNNFLDFIWFSINLSKNLPFIRYLAQNNYLIFVIAQTHIQKSFILSTWLDIQKKKWSTRQKNTKERNFWELRSRDYMNKHEKSFIYLILKNPRNQKECTLWDMSSTNIYGRKHTKSLERKTYHHV